MRKFAASWMDTCSPLLFHLLLLPHETLPPLSLSLALCLCHCQQHPDDDDADRCVTINRVAPSFREPTDTVAGDLTGEMNFGGDPKLSPTISLASPYCRRCWQFSITTRLERSLHLNDVTVDVRTSSTSFRGYRYRYYFRRSTRETIDGPLVRARPFFSWNHTRNSTRRVDVSG